MPNVINADNGVSSGSAGLKSSSDGTGILALQTNGTTAVTVDASQNVGIGTSSPSQKLEVAGNVLLSNNQYYGVKDTTGAAVGFPIYTGSNDAIFGYLASGTTGISTYQFRTGNNVERMRIDSGGSVLIGKTAQSNTTAGVQLNAAGTASFIFDTTGNGPLTQFVDPNASTPNGFRFASFRWNTGGTEIGTITKSSASAVAYNTTSDYRLKENVSPMTGALAKVQALNPVTYKWKLDGSDGQGFIAHELQAVIPDCVTGEKDAVDEEGNPRYQGIDTSFLVATLTAAIQEQQALITALTARIEALEGK